MRSIGISELKALQEQGNITLIDVRERHEWENGYIGGAVHVPLAELQRDPATQLASRTGQLVFVCARGGRSESAAVLAEAHGYQDVGSLAGGTLAWQEAGEPLVVNAAASTASANDPAVNAESDPALDALVATNLRQVRTAQGWSLDDLAREAGISRTLLGQLELGRTPPSISVVWKIAQTLGVPFSTLLSTETKLGTTVTHRASAKRLMSADQRFSSRALFPLGDSHAPEFYELWLAPHSREDADAHRPGTRENLVVTSGALELHIGSDVRTLRVGDAIAFSADVAHSYVNVGREECWMYLVISYVNR